MLSLLIAGGGTGGHLYPGIAVARELLARVPDARVSFVGTAAGIESRVVPREGFALDVIRSAGLKGKSLASLARGVGLLPLSALDAWQVLSRRRPSVVIGVGGYSSGPVVALAALRGIPTLLMEQNAMPGVTNRLLARLVDAAAVTYEQSVAFFGGKAFVTGNPVRAEFFGTDNAGAVTAEAYDEHGLPPGAARILVFGGSQGAHAINLAMVEAAPRLAAATPRLAITHQTGERDLEMVRDGYRRAGLEARVEPFLFAMDREMKRADLVICRAGATTLAELTAAGRASILVPLPTATDDHQRRNALALVERGAAQMIDQRDLTGERLAAAVVALAADVARRQAMSGSARRLARPDAARAIVDRVIALAAVDGRGGPSGPPRDR
jgi:UDP-N-acetylglucosamine--N-acetylmuramyl-(pentapeptide) pyrophosphoryl-undecaprenol N-acetylglucosamine transferase